MENNTAPENRRIKKLPELAAPTKAESAVMLSWLVVHVIGIPVALSYFYPQLTKYLTEGQIEFAYYAVGVLVLVSCCFRFLRKNFDPIVENFWYCAIMIGACYIGQMLLTAAAGSIIGLITGELENLNNEAIVQSYKAEAGWLKAAAVFLAPLAEELMFRGGIFANLAVRGKRIWGYAVSMLLFALYHVWQGAILDPSYLLYIIQYLPAGFTLCYIYERTGSIWSSVFLHMITNGVALKALSALSI